MNQDKKIVRTTLIVLFLSLFVIYTFYFQQQKDTLDQTNTESSTQETVVLNAETSTGSKLEEKETIIIPESQTWEDTLPDEIDIPAPSFVETGQDSLTGNIDTADEDEEKEEERWFEEILDALPRLTGTTDYFGDMEMLQTLGMKSEYVVTDGSGVHYAYMGTELEESLDSVTEKLWAELFVLRTELDIQTNELYGDKISFINIPNITFSEEPTLKRHIVYMVVEVEEDIWFVEVPYNTYYESKKHIKTIFEQTYE